MNKTQALRLLVLADSVSKSTDYDQNNSTKCAMAYTPDELMLNSRSYSGLISCRDYYGLNASEDMRIFALNYRRLKVTAKNKARQIRKIVREKFPALYKKEVK